MVRKALKIMCFCLPVLLLGVPSLAQNTKGDRPAPTTRDTRFKTPKKSSKKSTAPRRVRRGDDRAGKRVGAPPARSRSRRGEQAGKPIGSWFSKSRPQNTQKAWKGDITGRRIRPRSSSSRAHNVYPQPPINNYSSHQRKRRLQNNENPNVKRVRRMQGDDRGKPKVGQPIRPTFHKSRPRERQRAWKGDITGRPVRARRSDNIARQSDRNVPRAQPGRTSPRRRAGLTPDRYSGRARNIFSGKSFYVNKQSRQQRRFRDRSNPSLSLNPDQRRRGVKDGRIIPRSASAAFLKRRSINTWAHFKKSQRKQPPHDRDLAGRKLRAKNYETPQLELGNPTLKYRKRVATGERPYRGPSGAYQSRTKSGRAWRGDISHHAIRSRPPRSRERAFLGFLKGGGFRSATVSGERKPGRPLFGRAPGKGAKGIGNYKGNVRANRRGFGDQGEAYTGNIRSRRLLKSTGSVRTTVWNNNGSPIRGKAPGRGSREIGYRGNIRGGKRGFNDQGEQYTGNIKAGRRRFGNQGEEYTGNIRAGRRGFSNQGEEYTGNIKTGRRGFSNQGEEYTGNIRAGRRGFGDQGEGSSGNIRSGRRGFSDQGEEYTGNIRARREPKGGGSRGGHWNNNNTPIAGRLPKGRSAAMAGYQGNIRAGRRGFQDQGEGYSGNIKARRPDKGGGSVGEKIWNNNEQPILGKHYPGQHRITGYSGNLKAKRPDKGGGSVSGELWNNKGRSLPGKDYSYARKVTRYSGNVKAKKPDRDGNGAFDFSGHTRLSNNYRHNPNAADGSLRGRKAGASALKADVAVRGSRRSWDYIRNPSSDEEAQRTREPGRAFARLADFQGNMKVKRFDLFGKQDLHPDARFVKLNKNNVTEEKDVFTNFKLWWARLFRKNETQPDYLKEKGGKPRYDKGEEGLWYE